MDSIKNLSICTNCSSNRVNAPNCSCEIGYLEDNDEIECLNYKCGV